MAGAATVVSSSCEKQGRPVELEKAAAAVCRHGGRCGLQATQDGLQRAQKAGAYGRTRAAGDAPWARAACYHSGKEWGRVG